MQYGVPQKRLLGPISSMSTTISTFADDIAKLASDSDPEQASRISQTNLEDTQDWLKKMMHESRRIQVNSCWETCHSVKINNIQISQAVKAKYIGIYLDRRLTWQKHIFNKRTTGP